MSVYVTEMNVRLKDAGSEGAHIIHYFIYAFPHFPGWTELIKQDL